MTTAMTTVAEARAYLASEQHKYPSNSLLGVLLAEVLREDGLALDRPRNHWYVAIIADLGLPVSVAPTAIRYGRPSAGNQMIGLRRFTRAWRAYHA